MTVADLIGLLSGNLIGGLVTPYIYLRQGRSPLSGSTGGLAAAVVGAALSYLTSRIPLQIFQNPNVTIPLRIALPLIAVIIFWGIAVYTSRRKDSSIVAPPRFLSGYQV